MVKTIKTVAVMQEDSLYYLEDGLAYYENAHLVTDQAFNPALGIQHINLLAVDSDNPDAPQFRVTIKFVNGVSIRGTIFSRDEGAGLQLSFLRDKYTDADGQAQARDIIELPTAVRAQVLRYATTWTEDVEVEMAKKEERTPSTSYRNNRSNRGNRSSFRNTRTAKSAEEEADLYEQVSESVAPVAPKEEEEEKLSKRSVLALLKRQGMTLEDLNSKD